MYLPFTISDNTPYFLPNFAYPLVFINFLLGISADPRETEHYAYAIFFSKGGGGHNQCVLWEMCK